MRTSRQQFKKTFTSLLFAALASGFQPLYAETPQTTDNEAQSSAQFPTEWPGVYFGYLPCVDCHGIKTTLALNTNGTYILITQNMGKSVRDFVEKGKYAADERPNTLLLTPRDNAETHRYLVGDNILTTLDRHGNPFTGKEAERYILHRTDVTKKSATKHARH